MTEETGPKKRTGAVKKNKSEDKSSKQTNALARYFRETRGEMRKVTWPTRAEAQRLTWIVIAFTVVFAAFLGLLDFIWSGTIETLIRFLVGV